LRPGLFITARVAIENTSSLTSQKIVIPKSALQTFEDKTVIFVRTDKGFEPVPIELGKQNANSIEIISGIKPGQTYVSHGAFTLKAQLSKGAFGDGHNH
jgi:cobalt-zinc-cadmium efflux system membrane fusion protein